MEDVAREVLTEISKQGLGNGMCLYFSFSI